MTETRFDIAVETVLAHEGGFVDDPVDPGGATNYGISLRFLRANGALDRDGDGHPDGDLDFDGDIDHADIRLLTKAQAAQIYRHRFWNKYGYERMPSTIGEKVFDLAVNMGPIQAHKLLQRALRSCGADIADDGLIGPVTWKTLFHHEHQRRAIHAALCSEAAGFYRALAAAKPAMRKYLPGWLNRAYS